ncbi:MAG: hypothetical protein SFV32_07775 [Opitutaceae bacterium]|nr:hypothetical protein [Opitutaceae bacterium]
MKIFLAPKLTVLKNRLIRPIKRPQTVLSLWAAYSVFLIIGALTLSPVGRGDAVSYYAVGEALLNRFSTAVTAQDFIDGRKHLADPLGNQFYDGFQGWDYFGTLAAAGNSSVYLLQRGPDGTYHSIHFPFYACLHSAVAFPLELFGFNPLRAGALLNAVLIGAVALFHLRCRALRPQTRILSLVLIHTSAFLFYFQWGSPEVLIAVAALAGILAALDGKWTSSSIFFAIAALQSPPFIIAITLPLGWSLWELFEQYTRFRDSGFLQPLLYRLLRFVPAAIVALVPYGYNFYKFGSLNPVVASGYIDLSLIDRLRIWSFWFDLNQGMIVGHPWIAFCVPVALIAIRRYLAYPNGYSSHFGIWVKASLLFATAFFTTLPFLGQVNWNAGQDWYLRYAMMTSPLFCISYFWLCELPLMRGGWIRSLNHCALLFQLIYIGVVGTIVSKPFGEYVELKPWSKMLLSCAPELYNPEPEIFAERTSHKDGLAISSDSIFLNEDRRGITKILFGPDSIFGKRFFSEDLSPLSLCHLDSGRRMRAGDRTASRDGWYYANGPFGLVVESSGQRIPINSENELTSSLMLEGDWGTLEPWGVWTIGREATVTLFLPQEIEGGRVRMLLTGYVVDQSPLRSVDIIINGVVLANVALQLDHSVREFEFVLPTLPIEGQLRRAQLEFQVRNPTSPNQLGLAEDNRQLGVGLSWIAFDW